MWPSIVIARPQAVAIQGRQAMDMDCRASLAMTQRFLAHCANLNTFALRWKWNQSRKKFTASPGISTRIENTQPEFGYFCNSPVERFCRAVVR